MGSTNSVRFCWQGLLKMITSVLPLDGIQETRVSSLSFPPSRPDCAVWNSETGQEHSLHLPHGHMPEHNTLHATYFMFLANTCNPLAIDF